MFHIILLVFASIFLNAQCADHETFKNCSRVEFCSELRQTPPQDFYKGDINSVTVSTVSMRVTLKPSNGNGSNLLLRLFGLVNNKFRITIAEIDDWRYQLKDVLIEPLITEPIIVQKDGTRGLNVTNRGGAKVFIEMDPFNIYFQNEERNLLVLQGDMLNVTKNEENGPFRLGFAFPEAEQLYGVPEHSVNLALKDTKGGDPYRLKNSDVAYYELGSPMALYGAVPLVYGHGPNITTGVFLHNAAEQWIEIQNEIDGYSTATFLVETGAIDIFILLGPTPQDVVRQYTNLTGTAHLPPFWALGYHQSRYSYETQDQVKEVLDNFNEFDFQLDAIWLDIDYTDSYKYFTWNYTAFSDPVGLQQYIQAQNRSLVAISDPHIKVEQGYFVYDGALKHDFFVKNADGSVFEGPCWPGTSSYIDFLKPEARAYYGNMYSFANFQGSTPVLAGIWNDMNEPSVFDNSLEMTLPSSALHAENVTHNNIHNIYGFLQTMATHQGLMERDEGKVRPFILTRSHFAGSQRYAAIWTGDNQADWGYLAISYAECLNSNLMGIVFCGADVGGFFNDPDTELLQRWYQAGAWLPFYRAHSTKESARREPYLFDEEVQSRIRKAIEMRYQHLPMWYTIFYEHVRNGEPIIRPIFYQYPKDMSVLNLDEQLLLGSDIMVTAVTKPGVENVSVYFPGGQEEQWVSLENGEIQPGVGFKNVTVSLDFIPVYYRQGSIIVLKLVKRPTATDMIPDNFNLNIIADINNNAHGTLYIDDYKSFKYQTEEDFIFYSLDYDGSFLNITQIDGKGTVDFSLETITLTSVDQAPIDGKVGSTKKKVLETDANGQLLKNIQINARQTTIRLQ